jgi:hypothetical protein
MRRPPARLRARTWMCVIGRGGSAGPGVTREVLNTALASLGRPALDG